MNYKEKERFFVDFFFGFTEFKNIVNFLKDICKIRKRFYYKKSLFGNFKYKVFCDRVIIYFKLFKVLEDVKFEKKKFFSPISYYRYATQKPSRLFFRNLVRHYKRKILVDETFIKNVSTPEFVVNFIRNLTNKRYRLEKKSFDLNLKILKKKYNINFFSIIFENSLFNKRDFCFSFFLKKYKYKKKIIKNFKDYSKIIKDQYNKINNKKFWFIYDKCKNKKKLINFLIKNKIQILKINIKKKFTKSIFKKRIKILKKMDRSLFYKKNKKFFIEIILKKTPLKKKTQIMIIKELIIKFIKRKLSVNFFINKKNKEKVFNYTNT